MTRIKIMLVCLGMLCCLMMTANAEMRIAAVEIEDAGGKVSYPRLDGHPDAMVQAAVNQAILDNCGVADLVQRVKNPFEKIEADYKAAVKGDVLSVVVSAKTNREQFYKTVTVDLRNGSEITLESLFKDYTGAVSQMETICIDRVEPNVSSYLENGEVLPLPLDAFYLSEKGITLYYPYKQFSYFSGCSADVEFLYYELKEYLDLSEGGVIDRLGGCDYMSPGEDTAKRIREDAARGCLPGIVPKLSDELSPWLDKYRLLCDPDYYPGGRFFQTEAGEMRDIWLLTDSLTDGYDESRVLGIRADRINLYGIQPHVTTVEDVRQLLGQPETVVILDDYTAADYYLPEGESHYYPMGDNTLRMHYDKEGSLVSVQLLD